MAIFKAQPSYPVFEIFNNPFYVRFGEHPLQMALLVVKLERISYSFAALPKMCSCLHVHIHLFKKGIKKYF